MPENLNPTVFVVDDETAIGSSLVTILNMSGFQATFYVSAEKALEAAKLNPPSLLITDVVMSGMNGIDLAIQFKTTYPSCKTLLFSGQTSTVDLLKSATEAGHNFTIIAKPVHPTEILAALRKL